MTALLSNSASFSGHSPGAGELEIGGVTYDNSAAKFWSTLVDEVMAEFPHCDSMTLRTTDEKPLSRDLLRPQKSFEDSLNDFKAVDLARVLAETIEELELFGPPQAVQLRLFHGQNEILKSELPLECVDSELFPFLLVWLLVWAEIPASLWNQREADGNLCALDQQRRLEYNVSFNLYRRDISEGLLERRIRLHFTRYQVRAPGSNGGSSSQ